MQSATSGAAPGSLATLVALNSASEAGGQVLAQLLSGDRAISGSLSPSDAQLRMAGRTETSPIGPDASELTGDEFELWVGTVQSPLSPAGASIRRPASDASAGNAAPPSQARPIALAGTNRPRRDRPDARPPANGAFGMSDWITILMSMETTEATRQFAAVCVVLGAALAWKNHQSTRTVVRKAKDRESKAAASRAAHAMSPSP
jgi:hypothetical protein